MSKATIDVLITYGWNRVAYNVLRSLSLKGLKVIVGDQSKLAMSFWSKYTGEKFLYPSFYSNSYGFVTHLKEIFHKYNPKVYIPIHEETFIVAKYIQEFKDTGVIIPISDFNTLRTLHLKNSLMNLASRLGIPTPKTVQPRNLEDVREFAKETGFPIVIKMLNTNSAKGVFYVNSEDELLKKYEDIIKDLSIEQFPILQEYVRGEGYGVSLLFNKGELRAVFTHKRVREKIASGGTSTKRISTRNKMLEEYAICLLSALKYHGVAMIEFKYDEKSKKGWLIEVNPRFWGSLALPIRAGVNFPYLLYKIAVDGDVEPVFDYKEGVVARWILGDILATFSYIKARKSLRPLFDFFSFKGEKFDDLYNDDIFPFFAQCVYYFSKFVRTMSLNPAEEALLDIDKI